MYIITHFLPSGNRNISRTLLLAPSLAELLTFRERFLASDMQDVPCEPNANIQILPHPKETQFSREGNKVKGRPQSVASQNIQSPNITCYSEQSYRSQALSWHRQQGLHRYLAEQTIPEHLLRKRYRRTGCGLLLL